MRWDEVKSKPDEALLHIQQISTDILTGNNTTYTLNVFLAFVHTSNSAYGLLTSGDGRVGRIQGGKNVSNL